MKYCTQCGYALTYRQPRGDDRERFVCDHCGMVHYRNPKMVVGCIPEYHDRILLCRRAIEPRRGKWTLPAGYLENGESVQDGAIRETYEEARAKVEIMAPLALFNLTFVNQVYLMFRARMLSGDYAPGPESTEVALFEEHLIPWDDMAFSVIRKTLQWYFQKREAHTFNFEIGDIDAAEGRLPSSED